MQKLYEQATGGQSSSVNGEVSEEVMVAIFNGSESLNHT